MDNQETLATLSTQDTGQINVKELNVDSTSRLSILDRPSIFSNVYLACVSCT
jgi:hypothetical protein